MNILDGFLETIGVMFIGLILLVIAPIFYIVTTIVVILANICGFNHVIREGMVKGEYKLSDEYHLKRR